MRRAVAVLVLTGVGLATAACGGPALDSTEVDSTPIGTPTAPPSPTATIAPQDPSPSRTKKRRPRPSPSPSIVLPSLSLPPEPVIGADVSWPQCPKGMGIPQKRSLGLPMPRPSAEFVILGLTNGPGFTPNPCLADQVQWVKERGLLAAAYAVTSYPDAGTLARYGAVGPFDGGTRLGALRNVGYQQARFNVASMRTTGLRTPVVWLDVEPVPVFGWSPDTEANAAVVVGAARGYTDAGYRIGAYSTQALWQTVVGGLRLGIPEWRAAGQTSRQEALRRCLGDRMFQGGDAVLGQWVEDGRDVDITCPGTSAEMERWFHRY